MSFLKRAIWYTTLEQELLRSVDDFAKLGKVIDFHGKSVFVVDLPPKHPQSPDLPVIVCIHGLGGSVPTFKYVAPLLNQHSRVLVVDLPGHGGSYTPNDSAAFKPESTCEFLIELLQQQLSKDAPFVLVGHSYGTAHILRLAANSPLRAQCKAVVALTPPYELTMPWIFTSMASYLPYKTFRTVMRLSDGNGGLHSASQNRFFAPGAGDDIRLDQLRVSLNSRTKSVVDTVNTIRFFSVPADGTPQCPVLVVGATEDKLCPVGLARQLESDLKHGGCDAQFLEVHNAGHGIMFEKPHELCNAIITFLREKVDKRF